MSNRNATVSVEYEPIDWDWVSRDLAALILSFQIIKASELSIHDE